MASTFIHEVVAELRAYPLLHHLERHSSARSPFHISEVQDIAAQLEGPKADYLINELVALRLLAWRDDRIELTTLGSRTALLLEAVNSGNVREVFQRLTHYESSLRMYELVQEGMTDNFLDSLIKRPGFRRLYICSPWISLTARNRDALMTAIVREERRGLNPELLVLTRPVQGTKDVAPPDVNELRKLGATIFLHPSLHTKLYIREPGPKGGDTTAIIGSQNLTQSNYLELGIRINSDTRIVNQLITYFYSLTNSSLES